MENKLAVEWLVDQIAEKLGIRLKNSSMGLSLLDKAKEMEEDGKHESYLYGHKVGFSKANELWETSKKVAENQPRLKKQDQ